MRHANLHVHSPEAFSSLRYEAAVHRVQRVPATEKSGRIHMGIATVIVIQIKRACGAGGQHFTKDSAVSIVHLPTRVAVECQAENQE